MAMVCIVNLNYDYRTTISLRNSYSEFRHVKYRRGMRGVGGATPPIIYLVGKPESSREI